jgi:UDP-N-acetylmuramyl tripeptide synthase
MPPSSPHAPRRSLRARAAVLAARATSGLSQRLGRGHGTVIGGKVALALHPRLLGELATGRAVTIVTGTNGKTTTTRLVAEALRADRVVASTRGANLPTGQVEPAMSTAPELVLEIDELYVPRLAAEMQASTLVLLNISRDQLDRITEIRRIAEVWRALLQTTGPSLTVVANADDPLVVWAVGDHAPVVWVQGGYWWREDAALCPACGAVRAIADDGDWSCTCGSRRPAAAWRIDGDELCGPDGFRASLGLALPGRSSAAQAAFAVAVAVARGGDARAALARVRSVADVNGRFGSVEVAGRSVRLLLAKNPASWNEALHLVAQRGTPVVLGVNARGPDGHDTSWLWDVPFEQLTGRQVVATGDRRLDLALRLEIAGVRCTVEPDPLAAVRSLPAGPVDLIGTYTAFHDVLKVLDIAW